ncbi:MAG: alpha-ketoglutarate-dependent taurine dioxygenase [Gammaproteobacteria bacterium]|jgi:alpha-ketoglutarate-dependent taurine dioxygenase
MFQSLTASFGAETDSIDLSGPVDAALAATIQQAFLQYGVLVFRDQALDDDSLIAFASIFGRLEQHMIENSDGEIMTPVHNITNFDATGKPSLRPYINTNYFWHTDKSYLGTPSLASMLHPVELPASGGDTQIAHMGLAYAALADVTRDKIAHLQAVHSLEFMRHSLDNPAPTKAQIQATPPVSHPVVRTHAETGQDCLYIGMYASHIKDLDMAEGRMILARLQEQSTQPPFVYNHKWKMGDVVIWDNRCLMHRGIANYDMASERRVMKRLCVWDDGI